jgi:antitoxin MazE
MKTKVQKWGNSLGLRIPKAFAEEASLVEGSTVELSIDSKGRLIVKPLLPQPYELDQLLEKVTDENLHEELWVDPPRGREVW